MSMSKAFSRAPMAAAGALALLAAGCAPGDGKPAGDAKTVAANDPRDWSGVWQLTGPLIFDPTTAYNPPDNADASGRQVFGPGVTSKMAPPYNAKAQKQYDEVIANRAKLIDDDYIADCKPFGFPRIVGGTPGPIEIVATPKVVFMIWQYYQQIRRVYIGGTHVPEDERLPSVFGDSIGHWEGDTLVIDTVGANAGRYDRTGAPYSDKVHAVERWRKIDAKTLENQVTIEDPEMLTKPWTVTRTYRQSGAAGTRVTEFFCEGNRNPIVIGPDGKPHQSVVLPDGEAPSIG